MDNPIPRLGYRGRYKGKNMKAIIITLILSIQTLTASTQLEVTSLFFDNMIKGNSEEALKHVFYGKNQELASMLKLQISAMAKMGKQQGFKVKVTETKEQGKWSMAIIVMSTSKRSAVRNCYLIKEDKKWKVIPNAIRNHPDIKSLQDQDALDLHEWFTSNQKSFESKYIK